MKWVTGVRCCQLKHFARKFFRISKLFALDLCCDHLLTETGLKCICA